MANVKHNQLTSRQVGKLVEPGTYADGEGLTLRVSAEGKRRWVLRLTVDGQRTNVGLGSYPRVGLAEARRKAEENRRAARDGVNPVTEKRATREAAQAKAAIPTFKEASLAVIELRRPAWSNERHAKQWVESLTNHSFPVVGNKRVDEITSADVLAVLTPIWNDKAETAARVKQRMEVILDWAIAAGYRTDNPVSAIAKALPRRPRQKQHHPALPFADVPGALRKVKDSTADSVTKLAFEFLVLTATRAGEVRGATWAEIDLEARTWIIPASRMKARREHRIPLSEAAMHVLERSRQFCKEDGGVIFPAKRKGGQLSNMVFEMMLRRLEIPAVPHGFRSSFRDWMGECTGANWAVAESALAHSSGERASLGYHRTDYLEQRRPLMEKWADFVTGLAGTQAPLHPES
ncbi:MAG: tyrosine-type recombinase/integrase [Chloroflexi bacterium]|nr:tyrosine-type recombinase/integrase [Chloroflexota bacterium]